MNVVHAQIWILCTATHCSTVQHTATRTATRHLHMHISRDILTCTDLDAMHIPSARMTVVYICAQICAAVRRIQICACTTYMHRSVLVPHVRMSLLTCMCKCRVAVGVAVCCSVLQCVAVCCSASTNVHARMSLPHAMMSHLMHMRKCRVAVCVAVCCSVLRCIAVCCSVLQCVAISN